MAFLQISKEFSETNSTIMEQHEHKYYELLLLIEGEKIYFINGTSYTIKPNSVVIIPPQTKHISSGSFFKRFRLSVYPANLTEYQKTILKRFESAPVFSVEKKIIDKFLPLLEEMCDLPDSSPFRDDILQTLFSYLIHRIGKSEGDTPVPSNKKVPLIVYNILNYIEINYQKRILLEDIAKEFNYSVANIRKHFSKSVGISLNEYIIRLRISKAKNLLSTTKMDMTKIAEVCGFSSANYFSLMFKEKEKISPLSYRKINSKQ